MLTADTPHPPRTHHANYTSQYIYTYTVVSVATVVIWYIVYTHIIYIYTCMIKSLLVHSINTVGEGDVISQFSLSLSSWWRLQQKDEDVQSGFLGDIECFSADGSGVGLGEACGCCLRNCRIWFLDRKSAEELRIPGMYDTDISMSNVAVRNHKQRSRCIVMGSLEEPFLVTSTTPRLSYLNSVLCLDSALFQTAQDSTMGTAIMLIECQSDDQWNWKHLPLKCTP